MAFISWLPMKRAKADYDSNIKERAKSNILKGLSGNYEYVTNMIRISNLRKVKVAFLLLKKRNR